MKCIHKECLCCKCIKYRRKLCWRRAKCEEKQKESYCKSFVGDCSKFEPIPEVKPRYE